MRHNPKHHLGLGDIRLTIAQQDNIINFLLGLQKEIDNVNIRKMGKTTRQIENAPPNAIYIWVNADVNLPKRIAKRLGRNDIRFVSPSWIEHGIRGLGKPVVVDHATRLTHKEWEYVKICNDMAKVESDAQSMTEIEESKGKEMEEYTSILEAREMAKEELKGFSKAVQKVYKWKKQ